jgi:transposase InsO family protein
MTDYINYNYGLGVNVKRIRRLYKLISLNTLTPKPGLSKRAKDAFISPYLLNNLTIYRPNQVWQYDITYVAMHGGFMWASFRYKFTIIDVHTRKILRWGTSNTVIKRLWLKYMCITISELHFFLISSGTQLILILWLQYKSSNVNYLPIFK